VQAPQDIATATVADALHHERRICRFFDIGMVQRNEANAIIVTAPCA
jgi:hypothetical protein